MPEEPHLPNRNDLELPLLEIIRDMGGSIHFSSQGREIEIRLAQIAGVSDKDRDFYAPNYNSAGNRKWRNHIQFVRDQLLNKRLLDNSRRNYWTLTEKGKQRVILKNPTVPHEDISDVETIAFTHGTFLEDFIADSEGRQKIVQSIQYERSKRNRERAIEHHGNSCIVCGFNFDRFYGAELAKSFIEVHHTKPISEMNAESIPDINDLVPICSNCHSMAHRTKNSVLTIAQLKAMIEQGAAANP